MFPELKTNPGRVVELVKDEEVSFGKTLGRGLQLFEQTAMMAVSRSIPNQVTPAVGPLFSVDGDDLHPLPGGFRIKILLNDGREVTIPTGAEGQRAIMYEFSKGPVRISAEGAFKLHDTYGFPIDLTRIMAEERGMSVDVAGYEKLMEEAKEKARLGGREKGTEIAALSPDALAALAKENVKPTDDQPKYSRAPIQSKIMAIWNGDDLGLSPASVFEDEQLAIILDRTNFYAEMGGQVGDAGSIASAIGVFDVETTRVVGGYVLHVGRIRSGRLRVGDTVTLTVTHRELTEKNHTSTHLANWALREVLGDDVQQKGSLVDPEKLRFDFSHGKALAEEELARVETLVNECIGKNLPVYAETAPQEQALKIHGLRAVFGEKYPPMVRVVSVGVPVKDLLANPSNPAWRQYSIEFCGGTHLPNSSDAGIFTITAEESVSKGIRRLVALTGDAAKQAIAAGRDIDRQIEQGRRAGDDSLQPIIASLQKSITGIVPLRAKRRAQAAIAELQSRNKAFEKSHKAQSGGGPDVATLSASLLESAVPLGPGKLIVGEVADAPTDQLLSLVDSLKKRAGSYGVLVVSANEGRVNIVAAVSDDLVAKGLKAGDWLRETAKIVGGKGGGRPQMAQGSGTDPSKLAEALTMARTFAMGSVK
jgi:alanyl-tRNA synthetase